MLVPKTKDSDVFNIDHVFKGCHLLREKLETEVIYTELHYH